MIQRWFVSIAAGLLFSAALATVTINGCTPAYSVPDRQTPPGQRGATEPAADKSAHPALPAQAKAGATQQFWKHWGDGKAELSGYKGVTSRYGHTLKAETVLVYVTETLHRKTLIKDDAALGKNRISTLKLNHALKFRTGIYPYSVMTSVFAPVDQWFDDRFAPVKITFSGQEWCGHVFQGIWPTQGYFQNRIMSYFASEGEKLEKIKTTKGAVYEDALFIQLRELSGAFKGGKDWKGQIVPTLWYQRKVHRPLRPLSGEIKRKKTKWQGRDVTQFDVTFDSFKRTFIVETSWPRRILEGTTSAGEKFTLQKTARLPYWSLHNPGDEKFLKQIGLD